MKSLKIEELSGMKHRLLEDNDLKNLVSRINQERLFTALDIEGTEEIDLNNLDLAKFGQTDEAHVSSGKDSAFENRPKESNPIPKKKSLFSNKNVSRKKRSPSTSSSLTISSPISPSLLSSSSWLPLVSPVASRSCEAHLLICVFLLLCSGALYLHSILGEVSLLQSLRVSNEGTKLRDVGYWGGEAQPLWPDVWLDLKGWEEGPWHIVRAWQINQQKQHNEQSTLWWSLWWELAKKMRDIGEERNADNVLRRVWQAELAAWAWLGVGVLLAVSVWVFYYRLIARSLASANEKESLMTKIKQEDIDYFMTKYLLLESKKAEIEGFWDLGLILIESGSKLKQSMKKHNKRKAMKKIKKEKSKKALLNKLKKDRLQGSRGLIARAFMIGTLICLILFSSSIACFIGLQLLLNGIQTYFEPFRICEQLRSSISLQYIFIDTIANNITNNKTQLREIMLEAEKGLGLREELMSSASGLLEIESLLTDDICNEYLSNSTLYNECRNLGDPEFTKTTLIINELERNYRQMKEILDGDGLSARDLFDLENSNKKVRFIQPRLLKILELLESDLSEWKSLERYLFVFSVLCVSLSCLLSNFVIKMMWRNSIRTVLDELMCCINVLPHHIILNNIYLLQFLGIENDGRLRGR